jgi:FdhD protein
MGRHEMEDTTDKAALTSSSHRSSHVWSGSGLSSKQHALVNEVPVAIVFNGTTAAVMMATPIDIAEFALGFALTEGYIISPSEIESFEEVAHDDGIEARFWIKDMAEAKMAERTRKALGPMGCGLCGIDSLSQALRPVPRVDQGVTFSAQEISHASDSLKAFQPLHDETRSAHAAGFIVPGQGVLFAKEDVGRHNALDKLCGTLASQHRDAQSGAIIMTSRLSVDLVQKAATINCAMLIGVSAPSRLAVDAADNAGMTLIAFCRSSGFEVFTGEHRISF